MGLFFLINGWAGRFPLLDEAMRFIYAGTVPVLGTVLLGLLLLLPPAPQIPQRRRVFAAAALALILCGLSMLFVEFFASTLGSGTLSPRPFMTRYVNLLVVEPQDNSFPSPEVMLAAALATAIWALRPRYGVATGLAALLLGFARIFCGTNYVADVVVGLVLGWGWATLSLAACRVELRLPTNQNTWHWRLGFQSAYAGATLLLVAGGTYAFLASDPRFESKLRPPWGGPATATEIAAPSSGPTTAARAVMQEGEGVPTASTPGDDAEALALMKRSARFLPEVEKYLRGVLTPRAKPFKLLDVEVAPVRAGTTEYRCAALRFEITGKEVQRRRQVAAVAASLVKGAFHADGRLENVDITAVIRGDGKQIDGSEVVFIGDEIPIFTASIQRKNLLITPQWANQSNLDPGLWLRLRSRLYVNGKILPEEPAPAVVTPPVQIGPPAKTPVPVATPRFGTVRQSPATPPTGTVRSPVVGKTRKPVSVVTPRPRQNPVQSFRPQLPERPLGPMPMPVPQATRPGAFPQMPNPVRRPVPAAPKPSPTQQPRPTAKPTTAPLIKIPAQQKSPQDRQLDLASEIDAAWKKAQAEKKLQTMPTPPKLELRP